MCWGHSCPAGRLGPISSQTWDLSGLCSLFQVLSFIVVHGAGPTLWALSLLGQAGRGCQQEGSPGLERGASVCQESLLTTAGPSLSTARKQSPWSRSGLLAGLGPEVQPVPVLCPHCSCPGGLVPSGQGSPRSPQAPTGPGADGSVPEAPCSDPPQSLGPLNTPLLPTVESWPARLLCGWVTHGPSLCWLGELGRASNFLQPPPES